MFHSQYRIDSIRLKDWDYTAGWYFVTTCTHQRRPLFGTIADGSVHRTWIGDIVAEEWERTAIVRPYVTLDAWVVMPDHFHAIIGIGVGGAETSESVETARRAVSTSTPPAHTIPPPTPPTASTPPVPTPPTPPVPTSPAPTPPTPSMLYAGSLGRLWDNSNPW